MENVRVNEFDNDTACADESVPLRINAKDSDLGSMMASGHGEVTSITYRSPEAYFNKPWSSAIDIWAWRIVVNLLNLL
ncbi:uncharacterized protein BO97DRAFT_421116 [Aspergillus homomorphus CBS 101889]|uniref:Protein kinase domain-containing protein n=1 Tax=Aspergillus homomorphus (strain CBS 101889) TaxID=1450537 RepID=A0A395I7H6_ASPHC|nr:hypothetical protein BO97DRAFT_421116 [Aspergillus homomorphus CBS 101889]RAL15866.1 hypothetical protein BO97DRAFT_421116 [Aspergillus homomorphus CBS 101889]